jgi:hypothetical protein
MRRNSGSKIRAAKACMRALRSANFTVEETATTLAKLGVSEHVVNTYERQRVLAAELRMLDYEVRNALRMY